MMGTLAKPESTTIWLRAWERRISRRQDVMSSMYDLDGGIRAGQWGLVAATCRNLVSLGAVIYLLDGGASVVEHPRQEREWRFAIDALERLAPALAEEAWLLYLDRSQGEAQTLRYSDAVVKFLGVCTGTAPMTVPLAMQAWADMTRSFRQTCEQLGIPVAADWYLTKEGQAADWHTEVLKNIR